MGSGSDDISLRVVYRSSRVVAAGSKAVETRGDEVAGCYILDLVCSGMLMLCSPIPLLPLWLNPRRARTTPPLCLRHIKEKNMGEQQQGPSAGTDPDGGMHTHPGQPFRSVYVMGK